MSTRFSYSPELHLAIGKSRRWRWLQAVYLLAAVTAVGAVGLRGYPQLAVLLWLAVTCSLPRLAGQPLAGAILRWQAGNWSLDCGEGPTPIEVRPGCRVTPWVVMLAWRERESGRGGRLWVFADAVTADAWRRLRVRLRLQG